MSMPYIKARIKKLNIETEFVKGTLVDFIFGFIFANAKIFSSFVPFGLSYYAAVFNKTKWNVHFASVVVGTLFSVGFGGGIKYLFPLLLYTAANAFIDIKTTYIKAGIVGCFLFLTNTVSAAFNGFLLYDVVLGICESFIAFVAVFVFESGIDFVKKQSNRTIITSEEFVSVTAIYAISILCLSSVPSFFGINITSVLSITLVMIMCYKSSHGAGAMIGAIVGVINGINNYSMVSVVGSYSLCGLVASVFKNYGRLGVCLGFILANSISTVFLNSSTEILINVFDIFTASLIFLFIPENVITYITSYSKKVMDYETNLKRQSDVSGEIIRKRIKKAKNSFNELSKVCVESDKNKVYTKDELINMFNDVAYKVCTDCAQRHICWQKDYKNTYSQMYNMLEISQEKGAITSQNMPGSFKNKCIKTDAFALAFGFVTERININSMWNLRLVESRKNAANQIVAINDILDEISDDINIFVDTKFEDIIKTELDKRKIKYNYVWVISKSNDKFEITISTKESLETYLIEDAIKSVMDEDIKIVKSALNVYKILPEDKFSIKAHISQKSKDEICGDGYLSVSSKKGHILAISDGMGTGVNAQKESKCAINLLKCFYGAGFNLETSVNLINSHMLNRNGENFTTLDICHIDLNDGTLKFSKTGASASFLKTGIKAEKIYCASHPVGVFEKIDSSVSVRKIKDEACIIMVSDGVYSISDENWIEDEIKKLDFDDVKKVADSILNKAIEKKDGLKDDMTVIAAKISLNV